MVAAILSAVDNIRFIKDIDEASVTSIISGRLNRISAERPLLWLVPGGSAAAVASLVSRRLKHAQNVIVSLSDERYGPPGHSGSNWQLLKAQSFHFPPHSYQVLNGKGLSADLQSYIDFLEGNKELYKTALLGMGSDGHIAGILPGSPALDATAGAASYKAADFTRLTISGNFIASLDEAFVYAVGATKHPQIKQLAQDIPADRQPAQLLKQIPRVLFFNDLKNS